MDLLGIDMVRDQAEEALVQEVTILQNCKDKLSHIHYRVLEQVNSSDFFILGDFHEMGFYLKFTFFFVTAS